MKYCAILTIVLFGFLADAARAVAPPIELELVTERGVQITAPREWLQLLTSIGIDHVRIQGSQSSAVPRIVGRGNSPGAGFRVVGVLTANDQLRLPGGTFSRSDRARLKDYFARLAADGADAVTAPRVRFGLTEKELTAVLADLAQPIDFETKGQRPRAIIDRLQTKLSFKLSIDAEADRAIRSAAPAVDELKGLATGTALAITMRTCGLVFRPEKQRGQPVAYHVVVAADDAIGATTLGKMSAKDMQYWPIGWEPEKAPGAIAPSLFESLNAEIDGYTMDEALAAIRPRLKLPLLLDRAALQARNTDPTKIQVTLARTRTTYKRVIDRIVSQARLGSEVRVDEAGVPFLWITR
jgi:hypothetical protein